MPDAFFQKKRKRTNASGPSSKALGKRPATAPSSSGSSSKRNGGSSSSSNKAGRARDDEDDDMDDDDDGEESGDDAGGGALGSRQAYNEAEDEARRKETHAQARVRLAKAYLDGLKADREAEDGEWCRI